MKEITYYQAIIYFTEVHLSLQFPHPTTPNRQNSAAEEETHAATWHPWQGPRHSFLLTYRARLSLPPSLAPHTQDLTLLPTHLEESLSQQAFDNPLVWQG